MAVFGGTHGNEWEGQIAAKRLCHDLDADQICGRVILMPQLSASACSVNTPPFAPGQRQHESRIPGQCDRGAISYRIAHFVKSSRVSHSCEVVADLHSGGLEGGFALCTSIHSVPDQKQYEEMVTAAARLFDTPFVFIYSSQMASGLLTDEAEAERQDSDRRGVRLRRNGEPKRRASRLRRREQPTAALRTSAGACEEDRSEPRSSGLDWFLRLISRLTFLRRAMGFGNRLSIWASDVREGACDRLPARLLRLRCAPLEIRAEQRRRADDDACSRYLRTRGNSLRHCPGCIDARAVLFDCLNNWRIRQSKIDSGSRNPFPANLTTMNQSATSTRMPANDSDLALFQSIESELYTAVICDALDDLGIGIKRCTRRLRPLFPNISFAGWVRTISCVDISHVPSEPYAKEIEAVDSILPGEVVVVSTSYSGQNAPWGELLSTAARARGARGAVVDGLVRDVKKIDKLGFPVFARGNQAGGLQGAWPGA